MTNGQAANLQAAFLGRSSTKTTLANGLLYQISMTLEDYKDALDKKENEITAINRAGKIDEILNDIPFTELKIEDTQEYKDYEIMSNPTPISIQPFNGMLTFNPQDFANDWKVAEKIFNKPKRDYQQEKYRRNRKHKK